MTQKFFKILFFIFFCYFNLIYSFLNMGTCLHKDTTTTTNTPPPQQTTTSTEQIKQQNNEKNEKNEMTTDQKMSTEPAMKSTSSPPISNR